MKLPRWITGKKEFKRATWRWFSCTVSAVHVVWVSFSSFCHQKVKVLLRVRRSSSWACFTRISKVPLQQDRTLQSCHFCPWWPESNYQQFLTKGPRHHYNKPLVVGAEKPKVLDIQAIVLRVDVNMGFPNMCIVCLWTLLLRYSSSTSFMVTHQNMFFFGELAMYLMDSLPNRILIRQMIRMQHIMHHINAKCNIITR